MESHDRDLRAAAEAGRNARAATVCCHLADVAATAGRLELATTLLGTADSLRLRAGIDMRLPGTAGDDAEKAVASVKVIDVEALRATGRAMSPMEVVALVDDSAPTVLTWAHNSAQGR